MSKTMKTDEVINLIKQGLPVDDIVLLDIEEKRLNFRDSLLLIESGFLLTEKNLLYQDTDVVYDAEFDEVNWEGNYTSLQDLLLSKGVTENENDEIVTIELAIKDQAVKDWVVKNTGKMKDIVNKLVIDLYHTDQILHSK